MIAKKQIKILVIGPDSPHVSTFISRMNTKDYELKVISSGSHHISFLPNYILDFSLVRCWNLLVTPLKIKQIAKSFNPDLVWMHQANSYSFYPVLGLRKHYPLVLTVWGSDILVAPHQSFWTKKMTRYILKNVDSITSDANYLGKKTLELSPKKNTPLHICQFGIQPLDIPIEKQNIIYSNRGHKPLYRVKEIIYAFHRFKQHSTENWQLVIAGDGSETSGLKKITEDLQIMDDIQFVGFLSPQENAGWYGRSKLYASIPASDGTAVSLLEAMYYGCIPIVSDLPANREWINHGENGYVVTDLSTNFIEKALSIDQQRAQKKNKLLIEEFATPSASRLKFESVINKLLNHKQTFS